MLTTAVNRTSITGATPTVIGSIAIPDGHISVVTAEVLAASGADYALFVKKARIARNGAVLTLGNILDVVAPDRTAGAALWACTLIANGGGDAVDIQVTGVALVTIIWGAKGETWRLKL